MASPIQQPNGSWRYQPVGPDRKRLTIRWPKVSKRDATIIGAHIDHLINAAAASTPVPIATAEWLNTIGTKLHDQLSAAGLVAPRRSSQLRAFIENEIKQSPTKASTKTRQHTCLRRLEDFFGSTRELRSITPSDARQWHAHCLNDRALSPATVGRDVSIARMFFKFARKQHLIDTNPFEDLPTTCNPNVERQAYVTIETVRQIMDHCDDPEWRLLFAFSRMAGLRTPSEQIALRWEDISWHTHRFKVHSSKTHHHKDGGVRVVPIFEELRDELERFHEHRGFPQAGSVFSERIRTHSNLSTKARRIIRDAGVTPWPKPFHNLRSSCQTDLARQFPGHVVCKWIGNSVRIADKHYHQVTEQDFVIAAGAPAGAVPAWNDSDGKCETRLAASGSGSNRTERRINGCNRT